MSGAKSTSTLVDQQVLVRTSCGNDEAIWDKEDNEMTRANKDALEASNGADKSIVDLDPNEQNNRTPLMLRGYEIENLNNNNNSAMNARAREAKGVSAV